MKQLFKDKKYWKEMLIILLFGILINIVCFCMPMVGHCANLPSSGALPYNVTDYKDLNPILTDSVISSLYSDSDFQTYISTLDNYIIYVSDVSNSSGRASITIQIIGNPYTDRIYDSNYDYLTQKVWYYGSSWGLVNIYLSSDGSIYRVQWRGVNNNLTSFELLGPPNTVINTNVNLEYTPRYPFAIKETIYDVTGTNYVFVNALQIIPGEFTELPPIDEILNDISGNYTPHTNNTPPTYDSNLSDGENISNAITGHSNNMNNAINNLGQNIQSFFNKLYEKLTDTGNKISQNIYNGFSTLMQNIKDFFGPKIDDLIEKVGQIVDHFSQQDTQQDVNDALDNTTMHQDLSSIHTLVSDSLAIWSDTDAPQEFKIPLHLEELPMFNIDKCQYIDVGIFSPTFPYLRGIMWCFLVYSVIYTVIDSIANYIGGGDE